MKTNVLGYPRIGRKRELKSALEKYWKGDISANELFEAGASVRKENWFLQKDMGIDLIPSNDFSLYDQVLDMSLMVGCIPERYSQLKDDALPLELYFAMARGVQKDGVDIKAMEMTKWFDTNYHYIVPEFEKDQHFELFNFKIIDEYKEALALGIKTKPVIIGPVTYLLLGKEKGEGFHSIELLDRLLPVYLELLDQLNTLEVEYVQFDEPCLALDLSEREKDAITHCYTKIADKYPQLKIILTNYFDCYGDNLDTALSLPVHSLHLDLVRCPSQLEDVLESHKLQPGVVLSLGLVEGRNIWKNDFAQSIQVINKAVGKIGKDRVWIASSCSLLHCPYDLDLETDERTLPREVRHWLAFAKQKVEEIVNLKYLSEGSDAADEKLEANVKTFQNKASSDLIHNPSVKDRVSKLSLEDSERQSHFSIRQQKQKQKLGLPPYPTTTIGSFPQTKEVRGWRAQWKRKKITREKYDELIQKEIEATIRFQEEVGLDVLVHGECERNDMVEYFGERLRGFAFTSFGWVQSYGSRCVKPPVIFGDVYREGPMTIKWTAYAQSLTSRPVKGMLTGPVTILQWSFVRNDQPRSATCKQIALAIRDEVLDLEKAGLKVIQIDEPAIREGLPLRSENRRSYLKWAVESFKITSGGVKDETQIHTHMCYSEFNDIIESIADMDADVITIETSRSDMELLDAFVNFRYPNEIGPGVYDIHSPRIPAESEIENLLLRASRLLPVKNIWVNPDCGLKTRDWPETRSALENLVNTAKKMRRNMAVAE